MSVFRRRPQLAEGVYDELVTESLEARLRGLGDTAVVDRTPIESEVDLDELIVTLVRDAARTAVGHVGDPHAKLAVARRLLDALANDPTFRPGELTLRPEVLRAIRPTAPGIAASPGRPRGALLGSRLLTNAPDQNLVEHLRSEFETADRVDLLCAFVKLSGVEKLRPQLERHRARGRSLRVLTTTYMRATEVRAIELLHHLGAEVHVSYDEASTRLHAKAWIFHRESEYGTAYVGSSNLSHAAQTDGLEWNVRIAQAEQPRLHASMVEVFERYVRDHDAFERFDGTDGALRRLRGALVERPRAGQWLDFELEPKPWQRPMLRELVEARALGRHANLVVAATGTGKTLVAAFDYRALAGGNPPPSLLFVAHRREILEQARTAFRQVLRMRTFGEFWVDGDRPVDGRHVFASVQSLSNSETLAALDPHRFDVVIVDEVHHAAARSYDALLTRLRPKELVGLTATPERADGRLYDAHFPKPYVGNLRVWDAIDQQVLVPFRYFGLDVEGLDLRDLKWQAGYVDAELSQRLVTASELWVRATVRALREHIARPERVRALAFCVDQAHARVVADRLSRDAGLPARALTHDTPREERDRAKDDLARGEVQVLCVVDLFNEGVDLPDVDTLFLYRPTESATVFLQQLGRGLRRHPQKDMLTVFDLTGRQHPNFRFDRNLRALLGHSQKRLRELVEHGFGRLPSGCTLHFEERSRRELLERIARAVPSRGRDLVQALRDHAHEDWSLRTFLDETEAELEDLYRSKRSYTWLRTQVGLVAEPEAAYERRALEQVGRLLHVHDPLRLEAIRQLLGGLAPRNELERRTQAMVLVLLFDTVRAGDLDETAARLRAAPALCDELRQLLDVLPARADRLPRDTPLAPDVPLLLHAEYLDIELSAAFRAISREGTYRHFYTGVESVGDKRWDLLLVTLDKGDQEHEHLRYHDLPLSPTSFQWQSQAQTRIDDEKGKRHTRPDEVGVTPLLLVRERAKDERGRTMPFRFLGAVSPAAHHGERPITVEWKLPVELPAALHRRWTGG